MNIVLFIIAILVALLIILTACAQSPVAPSTLPPIPEGSDSASVLNGQRIYFYSTSNSGEHITYSNGPGMMMQGQLACVNCHGTEGHGGKVNFMMRTYDIPDITWPELTGHHMDHEPYTEDTIKRAIVQGVDPAGHQLEYPMPLWRMSEADLNDLISYMKTLK